MRTTQRLVVEASGLGLGWTRVAQALAARVSPEEIERVWVFPPFRSDGKEWGTAVIARRIEDGRSAIYTAKYMVILRGREKGHGKVDVSEVGSSSTDIVEDVLRGVHDRTADSDPPAEINPQLWFGEDGDESSSQD